MGHSACCSSMRLRVRVPSTRINYIGDLIWIFFVTLDSFLHGGFFLGLSQVFPLPQPPGKQAQGSPSMKAHPDCSLSFGGDADSHAFSAPYPLGHFPVLQTVSLLAAPFLPPTPSCFVIHLKVLYCIFPNFLP